jgi:hypothetical protein
VKCWGDNWAGQIGDGTNEDRSVPVDVSGQASGVASVTAGWVHTCALTTAGTVKCWGFNLDGELGDGTRLTSATPTEVSGLGSGATGVAAGGGQTCALTAEGGLKCWGSNEYGQLGAATMAPRLTPIRALGFGQIDFDNDDVADVAVYRSSSGTWFSLDSSTGNSSYRQRGWGVRAQGDTPVVGDFDGDGVADPTVYRSTTGSWFVLESHTQFSTARWFGWGNFTDTRMPGDYDGDGRTDAAVYRPSTGQWFILPSSTDFLTGWSPVTFGDPAKSDSPVAGDFDGDGKHDPAVYRPSTGTWFWLKSSANFTEYGYLGWGVQAQGDTPAPADYDGDGRTDPTVYRPAYGTWFVLKSSTNYTQYVTDGWGLPGDTPVPGDFDADGQADVAVYRSSTGEWFVRPSGDASPWNVVFGKAGDVPLVVR